MATNDTYHPTPSSQLASHHFIPIVTNIHTAILFDFSVQIELILMREIELFGAVFPPVVQGTPTSSS